jgi:PAS domain S-box-containing protein
MANTRILVVEDELIIAKDIQNTLNELGYEVCYIATSGEEAVKKAAKKKPHLVLMDIVLGEGMDGIEAAKQIQKRYNIPIVYLTAYADETILERAKITEPFGYIIKPFAEKELRSTIDMALYKYKIENELKQSEEKYRTLAENINVGIYRNTPGPKGKFIEANPAIIKMFGYRNKDEFLKVNVSDLYQHSRGRNDFDNKLTEKGFLNDEELQLKKKDGTSLIASVSCVSLKDEKGKVKYYDGVIEDITERKHMEEILRKHRSMLEISEKELKEFSRKILSIKEEDKKKLSVRLHDELGSMAVTLGLNLNNIEEEIRKNDLKGALKAIENGKLILVEVTSRFRMIALNLRPPDLEIVGLPDAMREHFSNVKKQSGLKIYFKENINNNKINDDVSITLYRIMQETLNNVIKHAKATKVKVTLNSLKNDIKLSLKDDGKGFDIKRNSKEGEIHIGIRGMREITKSMDGIFNIKATPGKGTMITVILPNLMEKKT